MTFSCPELSLTEVLDLARRYGYDGIEPRIEEGHLHGIEADIPADGRAEARRLAEDAGIAVCCIATSRTYADPARSAMEEDLTRRAIDLAADVGSPRIRVFGGAIPAGLDRAAAIDVVAGSLSAVAGHARDRGVTVCVETHDDWCDPEHVAAVVERVDHPSIAVNWDIMHPVRACGQSIDSAFGRLRPWIRHVHFHDGTEGDAPTLCPIGQGYVDHRRAVELLAGVDWPHYMSGEWIGWEPYDAHLPREIATMRGYEPVR